MELDRKYVPPWKEPYIIALAGSSGSGKTSIAQTIIKRLNVPWTILLSMDNFYKPLEPAQIQLALKAATILTLQKLLTWTYLSKFLQV